MKKKIFVVTGELSGDKLAAWYVKRLKQENPTVYIQAIGGPFLEKGGAKLYEKIETFSIVGIIEIVRYLPFIFRFLKKLTSHIIENGFDEVVLVDFPGFNLLLAGRLKKEKPNLKITYFSPPQLWVWGEWRIRKIKKFCDQVIVLYPFELDWYKRRKVDVIWLGYPFYEELTSYFEKATKKKQQIALLPGSRKDEVKKLLPILIEVVCRFKNIYRSLSWVLLLAESIPFEFIDNIFVGAGFPEWQKDIKLIRTEKEKLEEMSRSALAIAKPGTGTLNLALLQVPTIIVYKTSWLNFLIGRLFVKVKFMGLPNLFLGEEVFPELLQEKCKSEIIFQNVFELYEEFLSKSRDYEKILNQLQPLQDMLGRKFLS